MTVLTLKVDIDFKSANQVYSKLDMTILTSHVQRRLFPDRDLIQLKALIDQKFHHVNVIVLACNQHGFFNVQHVYGG